MTAVSGASLRQDAAYWALTGPTVNVNIQTCRHCKKSIMKNSSVMVREGRKVNELIPFNEFVCPNRMHI